MFNLCSQIWYLYDADKDKLDELLADTPWNSAYVRYFMGDIYRNHRELLDDPCDLIRTLRLALDSNELRR